MTVEEAYAKLGLVPVDEYIKSLLEEEGPPDRRLGATTFMLVHAALALEHNDVVLIFPVSPLRTGAMNAVARYSDILLGIRKTGGRSPRFEMSNKRAIIGLVLQGNEIETSKQMRGYTNAYQKVFHDGTWARRMTRRAKGPFEMIQEIRAVRSGAHVSYIAFAEDNEELMTLTQEGADEMVRERPTITPVGWTVVARRPMQHASTR